MLELVEFQRQACYDREERQLGAYHGRRVHQRTEECIRLGRDAHELQRDKIHTHLLIGAGQLIGAGLQGLDLGMGFDEFAEHLFLLGAKKKKTRRGCGGGGDEDEPALVLFI
jgi:hypothetical protein